jgi:hypothetical protein
VVQGGSPSYLFYDNLENPVSENWYTYALSGENYWYYPQSNNPFGDHSFFTNPEYTTSGAYNFWGYDAAEVGNYYIRMTKNIALPPDKTAYLHFNHAYDFYSNRSGGVVEYTINNGASYNDAGSLFTHNGYTGSIAIGYSNPLEGSSAFVTDSDGMISSRLNLNTLAGETVRFRFRIGSAAYEDLGWLIDDVLIYTCEPQMMHVHLPLVMNSGASSASAFHSSFNGSANNWQTHSGVWTVNPIYYSTPGISSASVSASYQQNFTDFTYEARMKRIGSQSNANSIMIRGTPLPLVGGNYWNSYYSFQYSADGRYSVYKRVGGASSTALQAWTASPAIKTGDSWNVLKVIAYDSSLYFYINGVLVWHDTDSDLTSGRIGLGMYMSGSAWNRLDVDWVSLTPQGSSYKPDGEISPEQRALNEAAALGGSEDQAP